MAALLDTNIAIHLRDLKDAFHDRLGALDARPALSVVTLVELEAGVHARPELAALRRARVDAMAGAMDVLPFDEACATAYGRIVAAAGYSRRKVIDRMIAATALVHGLTLITLNAADFADVPGLAFEHWAAA